MPWLLLVTSGKGGTGKSTVAAGVAKALHQRGQRVVMIDADLDGPSQAAMLGVTGGEMTTDGDRLLPVEVEPGLDLFSIKNHPALKARNLPAVWMGESHRLFVKEAHRAALERRPDVIVLDAPGEHGDALHAIKALKMRVDGVVIVTTPSMPALTNAEMAVKACKQFEFPIMGIIENMAFYECPHCLQTSRLFNGTDFTAEDLATRYHTPLLGRQRFAPGMDSGRRQLDAVVLEAVLGHIPNKRSLLNAVVDLVVGVPR